MNDHAAGAASHLQQETEASRRYGHQLADFLEAGNRMRPLPSPIALLRGEQYFGSTQASMLQHIEGDGTYTHTSAWMFGGILSTAVVLGANAIGNSVRASHAARRAAPAWRQVEAGTLHLTSGRLALQGSEWIDLWFGDLRTSETDGLHLRLDVAGWAPMAFRTAYADYWFGALRHLAYGEIVRPAPLGQEAAPPAPGRAIGR